MGFGLGTGFGGNFSTGNGNTGAAGLSLGNGLSTSGSLAGLGAANGIFSQAQQLIAVQQQVGIRSAELQATSAALSQALRALQAVAQNIGN